MKPALFIFSIFFFFIFPLLLFLANPYTSFAQAAPICGLGSTSVSQGGALGIAYNNVAAGNPIFLWDLGGNRYDFGTTVDTTSGNQQWISVTIPANAVPGTNYYGFIGADKPPPSTPLTCKTNAGGALTITAGSGNNPPPQGADLGAPAQLSSILNVIQAIIKFLAPAAALAFLIMLIFGGFKFITSGGDPKNTAAARSLLQYAIIGIIMVVAAWLILLLIQFITGVNVTTVKLPT